MSVEIKDIRNALIATLKADADLVTLLGNADKIDYGVDRNVDTTMLPKCIRVVQLGRGVTAQDAEEEAEFGSDRQWVWANYRMHVLAIFMEGDNKLAEDLESNYDRLIRKAIGADRELGGVVSDVDIGRTYFRTHPETDGIHFVLIEIFALKYESADTR